MSLAFSILGSGSLGNSAVLVLESAGDDTVVLIDCGLSPRATAARLARLGMGLDDVDDVLLTHLDGDHFRWGWRRQLGRRRVTVHVHERHRRRALRAGVEGQWLALFDGPFQLGPATRVEPLLFAHDALGTVGFVIEHAGARLGYATDLGRVPRALPERFVDLDALAIESNYDPAMQEASPRPLFLKRRIMGGAGHLSNEESIEAVLAVDAGSRLSHVVPLHLSRMCNHPDLIRQLYRQRAPHLLDRLTIATQRTPTPLLHVSRAGSGCENQMVMFAGERVTAPRASCPTAPGSGRSAAGSR